jgi:hypothetical protein
MSDKLLVSRKHLEAVCELLINDLGVSALDFVKELIRTSGFDMATAATDEPILQWSAEDGWWIDCTQSELESARASGFQTRTLYRRHAE